MKIRSYASPAPDPKARHASLPKWKGKSLTQQHFAKDADINNIVSRYMQTGFLVDPLVARTVQPQFGDFSEVPTFREMQDFLIQARDAFMSLPSEIRARFDNDPAKLSDFLADSSNLDEAIKLGIIPDPTKGQTVDESKKTLTSMATQEATKADQPQA